MELKEQYASVKNRLLGDESICEENRELFASFFVHQEYKLKRMNHLSALDDGTYKTLVFYASRFRTVNRWFANRPWRDLTKEDIKKVYDAVEDGVIRTLSGKYFEGRETYYNKILCGKPFQLAGKQEVAKSVLEFRQCHAAEVRFITEESFRQIVGTVIKPKHKLLLWLAFDIGENAGALLQLRKRSFIRRTDEYTEEPEYAVALVREILKRSRNPRTETTNYKETVELLDGVLQDLRDDELVFGFGLRMAAKTLDRATGRTGVRCLPHDQKVTLKDLRSSMACDLLSKGWTTDEVNRRLGHKPSSREIDKYVNWLALDGRQPKRKLHEHQVAQLKQEINDLKDQANQSQHRQRTQQGQIDNLQAQLDSNNRMMFEQVGKLIQTYGLRQTVKASTT
ncbi:MAG: hypothetical protein IH987_03255 [Planctomycetes bacterium]|nr:hypothetical protein [Planctomycetota bacterium]